MVGRASYIDMLKQHLAETASGHGKIFLMAGEAGIGKSRLSTEVKELAQQNGMVTFQGNCFEPDRTSPYAPILDLVRTHIASGSAEGLKPFSSELVKLLPELSAFFPEIKASSPLPPEQEKHQYFQVLNRLLSKTNGSPRLIILEDLQWCDDTSLEFLLAFARHIHSLPILLLLTYRSDEVHPALHHFLAEMDRARVAIEIDLNRLSTTDVAEMIRAIFEQQRPVQAEFVQAIYSLTDGNPFFVEETLKVLVTSGEIYYANGGWTRKPLEELHIPRTVQDTVQRRTRELSEPARQLLTLAAVAGRRFDFSLLQEVTGQTETTLLALVRELLAAQLVLEESAEHFAFRHALTRQAVYVELLGRERRNLHRSIAEKLEARQAENIPNHFMANDLSYHCFEAGLWDKAFDYSKRAADRAQALYTPRAAIEYLNRAIIASQNMSATLPLDLYRARGQQYETLGDFDAAQKDFQIVLDEAQSRSDHRIQWQALMDLGFLWAARDYTETGKYFQQALMLAQQLDDSAALAHILNRVGNWHLNIDQAREALRYHQEALRIFESLNDRHGLASTHDLLGITYYSCHEIHQGIAHYEQAISLFRELDDRGGLASSLMISASRGNEFIGSTAIPMPRSLEERLHTLEEALRLARETDARPAETVVKIWLGMNLNSSGNYSGFAYLREGLALAEEIDHQHFRSVAHMILGMSYLDVLAFVLARQHLTQAFDLAHTTNSMIWVKMINAYLTLAHIQLLDLTRAESTLAPIVQTNLSMDTMGNRHIWTVRAELLLAQGQPNEALQTIEKLIASSPNIEKEGEYSNARLNRVRGDILIALRRYATAEKILRGALASAQTLELRPEEWKIWSSLSRLHRAQGKPELADEASTMANQIVEELSVSIDDVKIREEFRNKATAQAKGSGRISKKEAEKRQFSGLTLREREVAGLIATGKSNLEIAEALTLSARTVEAHIGNILAKLDFSSRSQIAVWAVEKGLANKSI
jgi:tetratricopeptide (TPR) repeat protein